MPPLHTTLEEFENATTTGHFGFVFGKILGQENYMIIVRSSFQKTPLLVKMFSVLTKTKNRAVFKFLRFEARSIFEKFRFRSYLCGR